MKEENGRKRSSTGLDADRLAKRELLTSRATKKGNMAPDIGSQGAWMDAHERNEIRRDRASRRAEINPKLTSVSPVSAHPRELDNAEIIERAEAMAMLQVNSNEFSRLVKVSIIRKAHPDLRSQYIYRDVAALASTIPGSEERDKMQKRLRMRNTLSYMLDFVPQAYYGLDGKPVSGVDMDYIDRMANEAYQMGQYDLSIKFRSLVRPVAYTEARDLKDERAVQFLYLHDEDVPRLTTALEMRRWYQDTHPHTRYHVSRISLPPLKALNKPEHSGVLAFLVQAASTLYDIDFEVMPKHYYETISQEQIRILAGALDQGKSSNTFLYRDLTGARITDEAELHSLLVAQSPVAILPLRYSVAAWYQAYSSLLSGSEQAPGRFELRRQAYLDELVGYLNSYEYVDESIEPEALRNLRRSIETLIGCHKDWATKYTEDSPPAYIGQPPSYVPPPATRDEDIDPTRSRLHTLLRNGDLSPNVSFLMAENSLEDADEDQVAAAIEVAEVLTKFHSAVAKMVPGSFSLAKGRFFVAQLFSLLLKWGINPRSLYMFPFREAEYLQTTLFEHPNLTGDNILMDEILPELSQLTGVPTVVTRPDKAADEVPETPDPYAEAASISSESITDEIRLEFVAIYVVDILGFRPADIKNMSAEDMLEGLGSSAVSALDTFIIKTMSSEQAAYSNVIKMD